MMSELYNEDEFIPLSSLQHFLFCQRQCALILLEQTWRDNRLTVEGTQLHETADSGSIESRGSLRITRGLRLQSLRLGLSGCSDVVEFRHHPTGVELPGTAGTWQAFPVEYKRGEPKENRCDEVQLCAQALCLEEMLEIDVPAGALYYARNRRRHQVVFDSELRRMTESTARAVHELVRSRQTPPGVRQPKCRRCSLEPVCLPTASSRSARAYLASLLELGTS